MKGINEYRYYSDYVKAFRAEVAHLSATLDAGGEIPMEDWMKEEEKAAPVLELSHGHWPFTRAQHQQDWESTEAGRRAEEDRRQAETGW